MNATLISTNPLIAWPYLAPLAGACCAAFVAGAVARRARCFIAMDRGVGAGGGVLINPSLVKEKREPIKDVAVIAVDRSQSQSLGDRTSRTDAALADLNTEIGGLPRSRHAHHHGGRGQCGQR